MIVGTQDLYIETKESLDRIQRFDVEELPRTSDLGSRLNFSDVVDPAKQLIELYKRLSLTALQDFPDNILTTIRDNANSHFKLFTQILEFTPEQQDPVTARTNLINKIAAAYAPAFQALNTYIAYSLHRSADFQRLDLDARATLQTIEDKANKIAESLKQHEKDAQDVLNEIRRVAAEEGVTKQAAHFKRNMNITSKNRVSGRIMQFI